MLKNFAFKYIAKPATTLDALDLIQQLHLMEEYPFCFLLSPVVHCDFVISCCHQARCAVLTRKNWISAPTSLLVEKVWMGVAEWVSIIVQFLQHPTSDGFWSTTPSNAFSGDYREQL